MRNEDIIYEVNEKKGTVTARVNNINLADRTSAEYNDLMHKVLTMLWNVPIIPINMASTARCAGETFDEEKGKRVARLKLLRKVTRANVVYEDTMIKYLERSLELLKGARAKHQKRLDNICEYLKKE